MRWTISIWRAGDTLPIHSLNFRFDLIPKFDHCFDLSSRCSRTAPNTKKRWQNCYKSARRSSIVFLQRAIVLQPPVKTTLTATTTICARKMPSCESCLLYNKKPLPFVGPIFGAPLVRQKMVKMRKKQRMLPLRRRSKIYLKIQCRVWITLIKVPKRRQTQPVFNAFIVLRFSPIRHHLRNIFRYGTCPPV